MKAGVKLEKALNMPLDFIQQEVEMCLLGGNTIPDRPDALWPLHRETVMLICVLYL